MSVGILLLAGGRASRFGADKRLAQLPGGRTVIEVVLDNIRASGLPFLVCLRAQDAVLQERLNELKAPCHLCQRSDEGMGATLAEGVTQVPQWDGLLVALADMPWVSAATYQAIAARVGADSLCVPVYKGKRGNPVGFGKHFYPELSRLGGDRGARDLLRLHQGQVSEIAIADNSIHRDVDFPQDLVQ